MTQKQRGHPKQVDDDLNKIVTAALHAREIIKKLMVFARQSPSHLAEISLNRIVEEGLYFFEARCSKAGIELVRKLEKKITENNRIP